MHVEHNDISFGFYCTPSREIIVMPVGTRLGTGVARSCPCALLIQVVEASPGDMRSSPVAIRRVPSAVVYESLPHLQIGSQWRDGLLSLPVVALGCLLHLHGSRLPEW